MHLLSYYSRYLCLATSRSPVLLCLLAPSCRPRLQERARYYAVVYLTQMVLHHKQGMQAGQGELGMPIQRA